MTSMVDGSTLSGGLFTKSGQNTAPQVVFLPQQVKILPLLPVFPSRFGAIQPNSMKVDDLYKVALMLLDRALEDNSQVTLVTSRILFTRIFGTGCCARYSCNL